MPEPLPLSEIAARLDAIRLERDLTWTQLQALSARLGIGLSVRAFYYVVKTENPRPHDRTVHKLRKFIERLDALDADIDAPPVPDHDPETTFAA